MNNINEILKFLKIDNKFYTLLINYQKEPKKFHKELMEKIIEETDNNQEAIKLFTNDFKDSILLKKYIGKNSSDFYKKLVDKTKLDNFKEYSKIYEELLYSENVSKSTKNDIVSELTNLIEKRKRDSRFLEKTQIKKSIDLINKLTTNFINNQKINDENIIWFYNLQEQYFTNYLKNHFIDEEFKIEKLTTKHKESIEILTKYFFDKSNDIINNKEKYDEKFICIIRDKFYDYLIFKNFNDEATKKITKLKIKNNKEFNKILEIFSWFEENTFDKENEYSNKKIFQFSNVVSVLSIVDKNTENEYFNETTIKKLTGVSLEDYKKLVKDKSKLRNNFKIEKVRGSAWNRTKYYKVDLNNDLDLFEEEIEMLIKVNDKFEDLPKEKIEEIKNENNRKAIYKSDSLKEYDFDFNFNKDYSAKYHQKTNDFLKYNKDRYLELHDKILTENINLNFDSLFVVEYLNKTFINKFLGFINKNYSYNENAQEEKLFNKKIVENYQNDNINIHIKNEILLYLFYREIYLKEEDYSLEKPLKIKILKDIKKSDIETKNKFFQILLNKDTIISRKTRLSDEEMVEDKYSDQEIKDINKKKRKYILEIFNKISTVKDYIDEKIEKHSNTLRDLYISFNIEQGIEYFNYIHTSIKDKKIKTDSSYISDSYNNLSKRLFEENKQKEFYEKNKNIILREEKCIESFINDIYRFEDKFLINKMKNLELKSQKTISLISKIISNEENKIENEKSKNSGILPGNINIVTPERREEAMDILKNNITNIFKKMDNKSLKEESEKNLGI